MESEGLPYLSTKPPANADWRITLEGKVIAITGANQGIGLGVPEVCLANSARAVYSLDIIEPVENAIDSIVEAEGRIEGVVANAGITKHLSAFSFTREEVEQLFGTNVFGTFSCAQIVARKFISLGVKGSIVFTASMTSYRPDRAAPSAPYGGTKAAVRNMTHTLAMEWAKHGIRVDSVSPGFVQTAMTYRSFAHMSRSTFANSPSCRPLSGLGLKLQYYGGYAPASRSV